MNRRERREAKHARTVEQVTQILVGICALMGGLYVFCCCANLILHLLGVA
jgi:hypothetical protein